MSALTEHPTVKRFRDQQVLLPAAPVVPRLDAAELGALVLEAGADDAGFVEIDRPEIADQRDDVLAAFPDTKTLISFVVRMNRGNLRTPMRSIANLEFHHAADAANDVARRLVQALEERGVRAMNAATGFPMEMDRWPGKVWVVAHKPVAVAAGLGRMGIHRNVIHPKFGSFVLLGTVLLAAEVDGYSGEGGYPPPSRHYHILWSGNSPASTRTVYPRMGTLRASEVAVGIRGTRPLTRDHSSNSCSLRG